MRRLSHVIFDLGGVILDWNAAKLTASLFQDASTQRHVLETVFQSDAWRDFDRGDLSIAQAVAVFSRKTGLPESDIRTLMRAYLSSLVPIPESLDLLQRLHRRGIPLYVLSNCNIEVFTHLQQAHSFWPLFQHVVISGHVGALKPDPAIYRFLLDKCALTPETCVFVDDQPDNVGTAENLGMFGVRFMGAQNCWERIRGYLYPVREGKRDRKPECQGPGGASGSLSSMT